MWFVIAFFFLIGVGQTIAEQSQPVEVKELPQEPAVEESIEK